MRLINSFDKEVGFESLDEAKRYYLPVDEAPCEEYCELFSQYRKKIMEADTLEDLAEVLNDYTDALGNGSVYGVVR